MSNIFFNIPRYFQNGRPDGTIVNPISEEEIEEQRSLSAVYDMAMYYYDEHGNQKQDLPKFPVSEPHYALLLSQRIFTWH